MNGIWKHRLTAFYRERHGEPFGPRDVLDRFPELRSKGQVYRLMQHLVRSDDFVVLRQRFAREPRLYAPVIRGLA